MSARYAAPTVAPDRKETSGLSVGTLIVASLSSLAAALLVSRIWGGGTLIGAAATPVIVALVSEGLHRPARAVTTVRSSRAARFDPVAEGRRGLREGDLAEARPAGDARAPRGGDGGAAAGAAAGERRVHRPGREPGGRERMPLRMPRRRALLAMATGLVAFVLVGVLLTGTELVFGDSSVATSSKRTTLFGGSGSSSSAAEDEKQTTTPDTSTTTTPTTTEEPAPEATTPTEPVTPTEPAPDAAPTEPAPAPAPTDPGGTTAPAPASPPTTP